MTSDSITSSVRATNLNWQWQNWQGLSYLTCNLLSDWQHGFFTSQFYPRPPEELTSVLNPDAPVYRVKQVHGNLVLAAGEIDKQAKTFPDGDGLISDRANQSLWVASADCNPIAIGDVMTGRVSAIHAGWRGTAAKIVPAAVSKFLAGGSKKDNLRIAIGPAIAGEVYQVDNSVAARVGATVTTVKEEAEIIDVLKNLPHSPLLPDEVAGKVRLDVRRINQMQLEQLGINPQHIAIAPECTYQNRDRFFSYRRTGEKKVQWSGIISN